MSETWSLPGYDVLSPMGASDLDELWRARERSTGDVVALQRLQDGVDPAAVEQVRAHLPVLRSLETPYVVRVRALVDDDGARPVLVLDHAPGGSLADLLARRGTLGPGEVVTVAAPLASALAVAHARGVVHGDLSAERVLFTADGMPLLSGLGLGGLGLGGLGPAGLGTGGPGADARALAELCHRLLVGAAPDASCDGTGDGPAPLSTLVRQVPRALAEAVGRGCGADPASRPDAAAFAVLLRRAHPASPVRRTGGPAPVASVVPEDRAGDRPDVRATPGPAARRAPSGGRLAALGLVLLVAAGAAGGWAWGRSDGDVTGALPPASVPTPLPSPVPAAPADPAPARPAAVTVPAPTAVASTAPAADASPDWSAVLDGLDAARARALARADPSALDAVHAPSSPALAADTRLVEHLAAAGHSAVGVRHAFRAVDVLDQRRDRVRLRVVDVLAAHEVRDAAGAVVRRAAARGDASSVVDLARTPAGWRIVSITTV